MQQNLCIDRAPVGNASIVSSVIPSCTPCCNGFLCPSEDGTTASRLPLLQDAALELRRGLLISERKFRKPGVTGDVLVPPLWAQMQKCVEVDFYGVDSMVRVVHRLVLQDTSLRDNATREKG